MMLVWLRTASFLGIKPMMWVVACALLVETGLIGTLL